MSRYTLLCYGMIFFLIDFLEIYNRLYNKLNEKIFTLIFPTRCVNSSNFTDVKQSINSLNESVN